MVHFGESNIVTRQVRLNRTKIGKKAKIQMRHFEQFLNNVHAEFFKGYLKQTSQNFYGDFCLVLRFFSIFTRLFQSLVQQTRYFFMASSTSLILYQELLHCKLFAQDQDFSSFSATKIEHSELKDRIGNNARLWQRSSSTFGSGTLHLRKLHLWMLHLRKLELLKF